MVGERQDICEKGMQFMVIITFLEKNKGIVPAERDSSKNFIRKFESLSESTKSYFKNINTHLAYESLREERKKLRMNGETLSGLKLAGFLTSYSERKEDYVNDVKNN